MMTRTDGKDTYYIYMVQGISQEIDKANLPESAPNPPEVVERVRVLPQGIARLRV